MLGLLGSDLLRREETSSGSARPTHSVLMTGFMEVRLESGSANGDDDDDSARAHLSLLGKFVDLLQTCPGYTPLENAVVLLGIDVERLLVHGSVILNLVYGRVRLSRLLWLRLGLRLGRGLRQMVLEEEVRGMRYGRGRRRRTW